MRLTLWPFLLIILLALQAHLWFAQGGLLDMLKLKKAVAQQIAENKQFAKRNQKLLQEVIYTKKEKAAIESRARNELGMIKKDETYYQIVD